MPVPTLWCLFCLLSVQSVALSPICSFVVLSVLSLVCLFSVPVIMSLVCSICPAWSVSWFVTFFLRVLSVFSLFFYVLPFLSVFGSVCSIYILSLLFYFSCLFYLFHVLSFFFRLFYLYCQFCLSTVEKKDS